MSGCGCGDDPHDPDTKGTDTMNPKNLVTLIIWLAVLGGLALVATKVIGNVARKAESAL